MSTTSAIVYHCITCGRVMHAEEKAVPPQCCGNMMAKACAETIREGEVAGKTASGRSEIPPPVIEGREKPR